MSGMQNGHHNQVGGPPTEEEIAAEIERGKHRQTPPGAHMVHRRDGETIGGVIHTPNGDKVTLEIVGGPKGPKKKFPH